MLFISEDKDGNEVVNLTRGDDACLEIPMENSEKKSYTMGETEYLIFGVRRIPNRESELLINIESAPGSNRIIFQHADTADLDVGEYSAEAQLMTAEGKRITVWPLPQGRQRIKENINRKNFVLMPEVVYT